MTPIKTRQVWKNKSTGEKLQVVLVVHSLDGTTVSLEDGSEHTAEALREYWRYVPGGPRIITAVTHTPSPPFEFAREMTPQALYDALEVWISAGYLDEGPDFADLVKRMKGRIKRELKRRGLPVDRLLWERASDPAR